MEATQGNLLTRDDTFFGICQGLGEDLGFNPNLLRVAFAVLLYLNPVGAIAGYFGLGVIVLASRLIAPAPRRARPAAAETDSEAPVAEREAVTVEPAPEEMAIAA